MTWNFKLARDGLARRTILKGAGIGIGAGLVSGLPSRLRGRAGSSAKRPKARSGAPNTGPGKATLRLTSGANA